MLANLNNEVLLNSSVKSVNNLVNSLVEATVLRNKAQIEIYTEKAKAAAACIAAYKTATIQEKKQLEYDMYFMNRYYGYSSYPQFTYKGANEAFLKMMDKIEEFFEMANMDIFATDFFNAKF